MTDKKYGWFSAKSKALNRPTYIYCTPDGSEIEVSTVSKDDTNPSFNFPDRECLGEVTEFVRQRQADSGYT